MVATGQPNTGGDAVREAAFRHAAAQGRESLFRIVTALHDRFGREYTYLGSLLTRFWALLELIQGGHVDAWLIGGEPGGESRNLHPALLLAAAEARLTKKGKFPIRRFCAQVEQIIREEGS